MEETKLIDHFEILRELGRGGMGRVYLGVDQWLGRQVAIKVVSLDEAKTEQERKERDAFTERLLREARISAGLDHPGIVTIYQVGTHGDQPYIVMQFIDGPTLESLLTAGRAFDRGETRRILKEVAAALDHAHEMGVIHRDIKPLNIMLARNRAVKICDFGIAKSLMLSRKASSTLLGTPHYMAPEQLTYMAPGRWTDQWALGVVAYRMLTGRLPFQAHDLPGLACQIVREPAPSPRDFDPGLAPQVTVALERALAKNPAERYATCSDFAADLAAALETPVLNPPPGPTVVVAPQPPAGQPSSGQVGAASISHLGVLYGEGRDAQTVNTYRRAAAAGEASGMFGLGIMYEEGRGGLPKDEVQAVSWYRKAAEAGEAYGMSNLAFMYAKGRGGLPKDDAQAVHWYRKAAEAGEPSGMFNLGVMYAHGRGGLPKDDAQAANWYRRAAEAGEASGMFSLAVMYAKGRGGLPKDDAQAVKWYRRAAEAGESSGMFNLAVMYAQGRGGLPKDDAQAANWYRRAAEAGESSAMINLGVMYAHGRGGLPNDDAQAARWYRKAADAGEAIGMINLGAMYEEGKGGLPQDDLQAVNWYRKAADAGDAPGMVRLGIMYEEGRGGLPRDNTQAANWYRKAAGLGDAYALEALKRLRGSA